jgi:hypothetical protein
MRLAEVQGTAMSPLVAGRKPVKSCTDAAFHETIVYTEAKSERQMAVCSVPCDTIPLFPGTRTSPSP